VVAVLGPNGAGKTTFVRALTLGPHAQALLGHPAGYFVTRALIWSAAIIAVSLPLAVAKYRRG
jgi:ABC-type hemin transport system ATPase subunit